MTVASAADQVDVSVLVPAKDEADNLPEFIRECHAALETAPFSYEVVVVNDGSRDTTARVLEELERTYPFLHVVTHRVQRGIADALHSAGAVARGHVLVFYPADLQYHPRDIPTLVEPILAGTAEIVTGTKQGHYDKALVSGVYNFLCRRLFGIRVEDLNSVKAFRREVMLSVPARPDWHRFMVVIAAADGYRLTSRPVPLYPRRAGVSKFNWRRIPIGLFDLLSVWFLLRFGRKPLLFFGGLGALLFSVGFVVGIFALIQRFVFGVGFRPWLDLIMVLIISGVALFGFGFVGELIAGFQEDLRDVSRRLDRPDAPR